MNSRIWMGAMLLVAALPVIAQDVTPPVVTPNVSGTLGSNGWFVSDVALSWTVTDDESPLLSTTGCESIVLTQDDTMHLVTCVATSQGGTTVVSYPLGRDVTAPVVGYIGNEGTYTVDDTVAIACNVIDVTSGVASGTCTPIAGFAYDFTIGENVYTSTATDFAGNTGTGSATFTVVVDVAGMSALIDRFVARSSVARQLKRKLGNIASFNRVVDRETGKSISAADAETLKRLAAYL